MNTRRILSELERLARDASCEESLLPSGSSFVTGREEAKQRDDVEVTYASFIARGHAKVVSHYKHLLANANLTPSERADIEGRLARECEWSGKSLRPAA